MSDLLQLPIINSPPTPQPARLASAPEPEGSAFKDVLQNQLVATKTAANGKPGESSEKPAAEEAVSQPNNPPIQESEPETEVQPKIDPSLTVFDPALLGISTTIQPQIQVEQPLADHPETVEMVGTVQGKDIAIQTMVTNTSSDAKASIPFADNQSMEMPTRQEAQLSTTQATAPEDTKPVPPMNPDFAEEKPVEPGGQVQTETAPAATPEAQLRASGKLGQNTPVAQVDSTTHGKGDFVPVEQAPIAQPISTREVEKPTTKEPLKSAEPVQVQAPPGESPGQVEIRPTGLETSPTQTMEPARLAEAQTTNILGQITRQMDGLIQSGRNSIRIQLNPQDLGQIDLKITSTHQGVGVTMIAENSATGKLLENQMNQLRQTLTDAGIQIANLHIGTQSNPQSFHGSAQPQNFKNAAYPGRESSIPQVENERIVRHESSLIDYKI